MIQLLLGLSSHRRRALADALDGGMLEVSASLPAVRNVLGLSSRDASVAVEVLRSFSAFNISAAACAQWIRTIEEATEYKSRPELVWSGPELEGLHARDTKRVYDELLLSATRSVWASTYVFFDGPQVFGTLAQCMEKRPDLRVNLFLNIQRKRGDTTSAEQLVRTFADRFWTTDWPGVNRPTVFYDPRSLSLDNENGILHAKVLVVDETQMFVTSANWTAAALKENIEVGTLLKDSLLAENMVAHFQGLIDKQLLRPIPST